MRIFARNFSTASLSMSAQKPPLFHLLVATGFGSGFSPVAPGTAGALLAVLLWVAGYFLLPFAQLQVLLAVLVVYFTVQGVYSSGVMEKHWGVSVACGPLRRVVVCGGRLCTVPLFRYCQDARSAPNGASRRRNGHYDGRYFGRRLQRGVARRGSLVDRIRCRDVRSYYFSRPCARLR